jgi:AcrR family transcriptional regulator
LVCRKATAILNAPLEKILNVHLETVKPRGIVSPRPRKASDEQVFAATYRVMQRTGPVELTLAEIATEAGMTAGALVQRFGSKRGLLLALSDAYAASAGGLIEQLRAEHDSPLDALRAYVACMSGMAASPAALARNLAYLQNDLTDPELRKRLVKQARLVRAGLQQLIEEAVERRELSPSTDARQLTRTVEAVISGSMMTWAIYGEGTAARWMREEIDAVLSPYLAKRRR